ncbi:Hypothetical protein A7982_03306 [Minicystis rosea]|nr:Hypothetical protein A7982_03306 [Minicystis rosea]
MRQAAGDQLYLVNATMYFTFSAQTGAVTFSIRPETYPEAKLPLRKEPDALNSFTFTLTDSTPM